MIERIFAHSKPAVFVVSVASVSVEYYRMKKKREGRGGEEKWSKETPGF